MCFKNLPIEFDAEGRAFFDDSEGAGFGVSAARKPKRPRERRKPSSVRDFDIDPVTRVAGALSFHTEVDLRARRVVEARTEATMFRGYEVILVGREPEDAIHVSSRACGVCGGVHAACASMALEMAFGIAPPPLAVIARNLGEGAELLYDHTLHLFLLAGPDYSETVFRKTSPSLWARAEKREAPGAEWHGMKTVGEIMRGLNPLTGSLYLEALRITRLAREIASLIFGKYPHPSTIFPGGLGTEASADVFNQVLGRIVQLLDYSKKVASVWDDVIDFLLEECPDYASVGERPANFISLGMWDDPEDYDATYRRCGDWGVKRLATPGAVIEGELRTTRLDRINLGTEEFVDHSYYERWRGDRFATDPAGSPLSPFHPWNKRTIPRPSGRDWKERYTWGTSPRWDREAMESGPLARHFVTSLSGTVESEFIRPISGGLEIDIVKGETKARTLTWAIPDRVNALERNRARAYHVAYCGVAAYTFLLKAFEYLRKGRTDMATPYQVPSEGVGVGLWEAGRGALTHHVVIESGKIANYQIVTPSTWMASPEDPFGTRGPYEEAVLNTPLLEEYDRPSDFTGIDILRTIRSFDPCMPCTVHLHSENGVRSRDATSCACGMEG